MTSKYAFPRLVIGLALAVGCSSSPSVGVDTPAVDASATPDTAVVADAGPDGAAADVSADTASRDTGADATSPEAGTGMRCGTGTCGPTEVCCAASGPTTPERCTAASMCTNIRCDGPENCATGTFCCTDGIQALCRPEAQCFDRACRTATDCTGGQVCCPFGETRACRPSC